MIMFEPPKAGSELRLESTADTPTKPSSRIEIVDALRGLALFGTLIVNMYVWFGAPSGYFDHIAHAFVRILFEDKAWPLLSLLFGLGFSLQIERGRSKGARFIWIHLRRMVVLYGFGVFLLAVLKGNPILIRYAALGLLLVPFAWLSPRAVFISALLFFMISTSDWILYVERHPSLEADTRAPERQVSLAETTLKDFQEAPVRVLEAPFWAGRQSELFTMFLIGLLAGKLRLYAGMEHHRDSLLKIFWLGFPTGLITTVVGFIWMPEKDLAGLRILHNGIELGGGDVQSVGYAAGFCLLALGASQAPWVRLFVNCGRMPLTNYLAQWLLMRFIFDRYFLNFGEHVGPATGVVIAIGIYISQLAWSNFWLRKFQFGPAEWLWKTLTYMRWQPMLVTHRVLQVERASV